MLLTPTYHVFEMCVPHHDATLLPTDLKSESYEFGGESVPGLSASASKDAAGRVNISLCNLHPERPAELTIEVRGASPRLVTRRIQTAPSITSHHAFHNPTVVVPSVMEGAKRVPSGWRVRLPGKSIVRLTLE